MCGLILCLFNCLDDFHKHENKNNCLYCFYLPTLISCLAFAGFYFYIFDNSSFVDINFLKGIRNDLEKTPIFDIIIDKHYNFKSEYDFNVFKRYKGTNRGCKCEKENNENIVITEGYCKEEQIRDECEDFMISSKNLYKYRNKYFNIKRENLYTFQKNLIVPSYKPCPKGKKKCGILDSLDNILCLNESEKCPINDIIINNNEKMDGYNSFELNEGKYFHFTNRLTDKHIISDLSVFFQQPCPYSQDNFWEKFFKNENDEGSLDCKKSKGEFDYRYKYLDKYNLSLFYKDNYIFYESDYKILIPEKREKFFSSEIELYKRDYIAINYARLNNSKIKNLVNLDYELYDLKNAKNDERKFYSGISLKIQENYIAIIFSFSSFIITISRIIFSFFYKEYFIDISLTKDIFLYIIIPEFLLIYFFIAEFLQIKKMKRSVNEIVDDIYYFFDHYTQIGFDFIKKDKIDITSIRTYNLAALGVIILLLFLIMSPCLLLHYYNKNMTNKDSQNEQENFVKGENIE